MIFGKWARVKFSKQGVPSKLVITCLVCLKISVPRHVSQFEVNIVKHFPLPNLHLLWHVRIWFGALYTSTQASISQGTGNQTQSAIFPVENEYFLYLIYSPFTNSTSCPLVLLFRALTNVFTAEPCLVIGLENIFFVVPLKRMALAVCVANNASMQSFLYRFLPNTFQLCIYEAHNMTSLARLDIFLIFPRRNRENGEFVDTRKNLENDESCR